MRRVPAILSCRNKQLAPLPALAATPGVPRLNVPTHTALAGDNFPGKSPTGKNGGGKLAGFFTPQQRVMSMMQARQQLKDMTPEQKRAYRKEQISKIVAMSPSEREKLKTDLQAQWDALPPGQKNRMEQRLAAQDSKTPAQ